MAGSTTRVTHLAAAGGPTRQELDELLFAKAKLTQADLNVSRRTQLFDSHWYARLHAETNQLLGAKPVRHRAEFRRQVDCAAQDGKPLRPFPIVPQTICLDEAYCGVNDRSRGEKPQPAVT